MSRGEVNDEAIIEPGWGKSLEWVPIVLIIYVSWID